jgi:hypothetical protein
MDNLSRVTKPQLPLESLNLEVLGAELERQAEIYKGLGVSKDVIMRLAAPRPEKLPKELNIPVVTLGSSVDFETYAKFAKVDINFSHSVIFGDIAGGITYPEPHLIWMSDGSTNLDVSPKDVRADLPANARPATITDGIALALVHPDIAQVLKTHEVNCPGTALDDESTPCLNNWGSDNKTLCMDSHYIEFPEPTRGSALSGN